MISPNVAQPKFNKLRDIPVAFLDSGKVIPFRR
jgi:hypothetical protein